MNGVIHRSLLTPTQLVLLDKQRELEALQNAVDAFLVAPKLGGEYSRALMRLRSMSARWKVARAAGPRQEEST